MDRTLHIPQDFEKRPEVRLFNRSSCVMSQAEAVVMILRLWLEFAREGLEFRIFKVDASDLSVCCLSDDPLTYIIEDSCGWKGQPGLLLAEFISCGALRVECREGVWGLVLNGFALHNAHLSPDYMTMQQRGGIARKAKIDAEALARAADDQRKILQGSLSLEQLALDSDAQNKAIALVMRLDRAGGHSLRATGDYSDDLIRDASGVLARFDDEQIARVEKFIYESRENPSVVKITERILENFPSYLGKSGGK